MCRVHAAVRLVAGLSWALVMEMSVAYAAPHCFRQQVHFAACEHVCDKAEEHGAEQLC